MLTLEVVSEGTNKLEELVPELPRFASNYRQIWTVRIVGKEVAEGLTGAVV